MYAVLETGGKQYRVVAGDKLEVESLEAEAGKPFTFDRVLLVNNDGKLSVGAPTVSGATVTSGPEQIIRPAHLLASAALFMVILFETARIPVETHTGTIEFGMIEEARSFEHSGPYLALLKWGSAAKQLIFYTILLNVFVVLADDVTEGETNHLDRAVLMALRAPGRPHQPIGPQWLDLAARDFTALGSITVLATLVLLVAGLFASLRRFREGLMLIAAGLGGIAVSQLVKDWIGRARPDLVFRAVEAANPSFPSGHAMLSAGVYLTLGALASRFSPRLRIRVFALVAAILVTLVVGLTRIFLGVHWPTDVLAGWCVGAAWALGCWLAEGLWERRHGRP